MDHIQKEQFGLTFRTLQYLKMNLFVNQYQVDPQAPYHYVSDGVDHKGTFNFSETGVKMKFAYNEKFIETPWGKISEGTNYPVLYVNVTKSNKWLNGEFDNLRMEGRLSKTFLTRNFGKTHMNVMGGLATGELPVFNLYNGNGSFGSRFSLQIDNTFATMHLNEFFAQQFVSVFFRQNFGSLLFKTKKFSPRFSIVTNAGWGWLDHAEDHKGMLLKSFDKGYYESGLLFDNLFSVNFISYGLGVYYRYGPYSYDKIADNFAYKLSFRFAF